MSYNINNSNILQYYPLNANFYDYSSGSPVNNSTVGGSFALTTLTSIDGSGSAYSPGWSAGGTNKSYLTMSSQSPTFSNGFTVALWIKYRNVPSGQAYSRFFNWIDRRAGATSNYNMSLNVNGSTLHATVYGSSTIGQQTVSTGYVINDTNWHHYCLTYASTGTVNVYVDGVSKLSFTHLHNGQPLYVCELARNYYGESGLDGYFDQYVAFNRTLTTTEISYLASYAPLVTFTSAASGYISPYTVGTAPSITSITNGYFSFNVNFTAGTGGNPAPTTYYYSLNGGAYTNANTTTSPILITGVNIATTYNIAIIANNLAGNTAASNIAVGFIPYPCFLEGSKILRFSPETYQDEYVQVETLRKGDLIATSESGYQPIHSIGYKTIPCPKSDPNPSNRLYKFSKKTCPSVFEPLYITGEHCTLHRNIPKDKRDRITEHMGDVYITEEYYRMPAFLDDRGEPYDGEDSPATIWHFALEHENVAHNYGVWANGLLVESCAIESLMEKSGMRLLE